MTGALGGEAVLAPVATLLGTLAIVGGAVMWLAKLAAEKVLAAHKEAAAKDADELREQVATLRAEVAELRGAAQPTIRAMERLLGAIEGGRR